jgi:hypothetical protein
MEVMTMSMVTEIRLLFIVGIVALAAGIVAVAMLTQWLTDRIVRGRAWLAVTDFRGARGDHGRHRLEHELGARSARWRMLL